MSTTFVPAAEHNGAVALDPADAVVVGVLVEVGVEAGNHGDRAIEGVPQGRMAEGCLGGDVDDIGRERGDRAKGLPEGWQRQPQLGVKRNNDLKHRIANFLFSNRQASIPAWKKKRTTTRFGTC